MRKGREVEVLKGWEVGGKWVFCMAEFTEAAGEFALNQIQVKRCGNHAIDFVWRSVA